MHIQSPTSTHPTQPVAQSQAMKEGQIFHGKITQLFPGQTAQVQIGKEQLVAKLEVPMKAGDAHFFQVMETSPELKLKVMTEPVSQDLKQSVSQLIDHLKLPQTKEMQQIVQQMLQQKVPLQKEQLVQLEQLLKQQPQLSATALVQAVKQLQTIAQPITAANVTAMLQFAQKEPFMPLLAQVIQMIQADETILQSVRQQFDQMMQQLGAPVQDKVNQLTQLQSLQQLMKQENVAPLLRIVQQEILQALARPMEPMPMTREQALDLNQLVRQLQQLMQQPNQSMTSIQQNQMMQQLSQLPSLAITTQQQLNNLVQPISQQADQQTPMTTQQQFTQQIIHLFSQQAAQQKETQPFGAKTTEQLATIERLPPQVLERMTQLMMQQPVAQETQNAEQLVLSKMDGAAFKQLIQHTFQQLGMNYEAQVLKTEALEQLATQLKPQLIQLLQEASLPLTTREAVEQLVARMQLPVLASQDQHIQQLVMQVPLNFLGKKIEAMLEWSGKTTEDGKIDENFARVLFYLDLEHIQETVIDMQVQNRIVSVTIYNDTTGIQQNSQLPINDLKKGLQTHDYRLSGLYFKPMQEREPVKVPKQEFDNYVSTTGVDVRI